MPSSASRLRPSSSLKSLTIFIGLFVAAFYLLWTRPSDKAPVVFRNTYTSSSGSAPPHTPPFKPGQGANKHEPPPVNQVSGAGTKDNIAVAAPAAPPQSPGADSQASLAGTAASIAAAAVAGSGKGLSAWPRIIYQASPHQKSTSLSQSEQQYSDTWEALNSGYDRKIMADADMQADVRTLFKDKKKLLTTIAQIKDYDILSRIVRYVLLSTNGGVYSDVNVACEKSIEDWVPSNMLAHKDRIRLILGVKPSAKTSETSFELADWTMIAKPESDFLDFFTTRMLENLLALAMEESITLPKMTASIASKVIGTKALTEAFLEYARKTTGTAVTPADFSYAHEATLIGEVLILPAYAFGATSRSSSDQALVYYHSTAATPDSETSNNDGQDKASSSSSNSSATNDTIVDSASDDKNVTTSAQEDEDEEVVFVEEKVTQVHTEHAFAVATGKPPVATGDAHEAQRWRDKGEHTGKGAGAGSGSDADTGKAAGSSTAKSGTESDKKADTAKSAASSPKSSMDKGKASGSGSGTKPETGAALSSKSSKDF